MGQDSRSTVPKIAEFLVQNPLDLIQTKVSPADLFATTNWFCAPTTAKSKTPPFCFDSMFTQLVVAFSTGRHSGSIVVEAGVVVVVVVVVAVVVGGVVWIGSFKHHCCFAYCTG